MQGRFRGFRGRLFLADRGAGVGRVVTLYETGDDPQRVETGGQCQEPISRFCHLLVGPPTREVYEVGVDHGRGEARYATVLTGRVRPDLVDEAVRRAREHLVPAIEREQGGGGLVQLSDRATGRAVIIALHGPEAGARLAEEGDREQRVRRALRDLSTGPPVREAYATVASRHARGRRPIG